MLVLFTQPMAVAACVVTLGALTPFNASAQTPPAPAANRFGVVHDHIAVSPEVRGRIREAGLGWVHYILYWNLVNPRQPASETDDTAYEWAAVDAEIDALVAEGLNVFVRVTTPPTWTTGASYPNEAILYCFDESDPGNDGTYTKTEADCRNGQRRPGYRASPPPGYDRTGDFRRFVRTAVERYRGKVRAWGFGTEFHAKYFWTGSGFEFIDEVLRPGYQEVKAIDPSLLVVGPDEDHLPTLQFVFEQEQRQLAQGRLFDVIAVHTLGHQGWDPPTAGDRFDTLLRPLIEQYGLGRPIWLTELGERYDEQISPDHEGDQASWYAGMLDVIRARPWLDKVFFYRLRQDNANDFGLVRGDNTTRPAYDYVKSFVSLIADPRFYYLAEGATNPAFWDLDVLIANPNAEPAPVKVTFLTDAGDVLVHPIVMAATSRVKLEVGSFFGSTPLSVSTIVESAMGLPLVVERTMSWDTSGYAGHTGTAVEAPSTTWYFAEGSQGFFDKFLLLSNSDIVPATVEVRFLRQGLPPVTDVVTVDPNSRRTVWAGDYAELVDQSFAIVVNADRPIIAERAMYFGVLPFWKGGHESAGVPALSTEWFLAEGATGPFFDAWILMGNPNDADAEVTVDYLLAGQPGYSRTFTLPGNERATILIDNETFDGVPGTPLADVAVSTRVTSTEPIVVERAMYWPAVWSEAHNSFGVTATALKWGLAEGRLDGPRGYETYILVVNPDPVENAPLRVTYLLADGTTVVDETHVVPAGQRHNVFPAAAPELRGREFGTVIESVSGVGIVVERAMYWNHAVFGTWAAGTNATGTPLP